MPTDFENSFVLPHQDPIRLKYAATVPCEILMSKNQWLTYWLSGLVTAHYKAYYMKSCQNNYEITFLCLHETEHCSFL